MSIDFCVNNRERKEPYQFLTLLAMIYVLAIIAGFLFVSKKVKVPYIGFASVGAFVLPCSFIVINIVAEVYGYYAVRQIIWSGVIAQGFFCFVSYILLYIPTEVTHAAYASFEVYFKIFGQLPRIYISSTIAIIIAIFLNAYVLVKWKILLNGKYFLLRSLGASVIGEGIFTLLSVLMICLGRYPLSMIIQFFVISYLAKIITTLLLSYPAAILAELLKRIERVDTFDYDANFNIFDFRPAKTINGSQYNAKK